MAIVEYPEIGPLWRDALDGSPSEIESFLCAQSRLPGPRSNLELAQQFADYVSRYIVGGDEPSDETFRILMRWLDVSTEFDSSIDPKQLEFLSAAAALAAGMAAENPGSWDEAMVFLSCSAADSRWRVRELSATGMQHALTADWGRAIFTIRRWLATLGDLHFRCAVAAVAEPRLLHKDGQVVDAFEIICAALAHLLELTPEDRRAEDARTLRKALGYAISVVSVADPDMGFEVLNGLVQSEDADARWIVRENLKKARIRILGGRADRLRALVGAR